MAFSDNFEAFKEAAAGVAQNAAQKTRLLATIAKDNLAILSEEDKIKKAQTELGKLYYKDFIMDKEPDEAEYLPWCDKITASRKNIETLREEIAQAKEELGGDKDDLEIVPVEVAYPEEATAEEPVAEGAADEAEPAAEDVEVPVCDAASEPEEASDAEVPVIDVEEE